MRPRSIRGRRCAGFPAGRFSVSGFLIDETTVTNADYDAFVAAFGYVTVAERPIADSSRNSPIVRPNRQDLT